jgi:hypothetical protein
MEQIQQAAWKKWKKKMMEGTYKEEKEGARPQI